MSGVSAGSPAWKRSGGSLVPALSEGQTGATRLAVGTTAQRPGTPAAGDVRANTTTGLTELYNGSSWDDVTPTESGGSLTATTTSISADDTWTDVTAASLTLGTAGTWLVIFDVRCRCSVSSGGGSINLRLYDSTNTAVVTNSERRGLAAGTGGGVSQVTVTLSERITVSTSSSIKLQALRTSGATYAASEVTSDSNGYTRGHYTKMSS